MLELQKQRPLNFGSLRGFFSLNWLKSVYVCWGKDTEIYTMLIFIRKKSKLEAWCQTNPAAFWISLHVSDDQTVFILY